MDSCWEGLEDCIELLKTGKYEVLTRSEDGAKFIFPITEPELHATFKRTHDSGPISSLDDFSVVFPPQFQEGYHSWVPTDGFLLHIRPTNLGSFNEEIAYVGRFSYEPVSREFLPATIGVAHNSTIHMHGTHEFNEYVRGIYLRERGLILIRAYFNPLDEKGNFDPYREYDPATDREKTKQTIDMLIDNGLPDSVRIITRANNKLIRETCLKGLIGYI